MSSSSLFVGKIRIYHKGCWASVTTEEHKDITLDIFVIHIDAEEYRVLAIVKPKEGTLSPEKREAILNTINKHSAVSRCTIARISRRMIMESEYFMMLNVVVRDEESRPEGAIRPIEFYGRIPRRDIGHRASEGWEEVYGLFHSRESFQKCLGHMEKIHEKNVDLENSKLADEAGLKGEPPLFLESIACGKARNDKYRAGIDLSLLTGSFGQDIQDTWIDECAEFLAKARKASENIPDAVWILIAAYFYWVLTGQIVFPF